MSKKDSFKTVAHEAQTLIVEKKSKFIANVKPVDNEANALAFLAAMRSKYSDATHNVYAYVIDENNIFRYSDDGEPSGTAGMPVLDTIRKAGLVDVIVVVTRYFGGTLLGTGGLVHTYGAAAREGLEAAKRIVRSKCNIVSVKADYTLVGKLQYMIAEEGYDLEDTIYESDVTFKVICPLDITDSFIKDVTELTNGRAACSITDTKYVDKEEPV